MFLTEDLLKRMIREISDEYLTQLPGTEVGSEWDGEVSDAERSMDAFTAELEEIEIPDDAGVNFMGQSMAYDDFLSIIGNYVATREQRRHGGAPDKQLRKDIKRSIREALYDIPQRVVDAVAELLEDYIDDDNYEYGPKSQEPYEGEDW